MQYIIQRCAYNNFDTLKLLPKIAQLKSKLENTLLPRMQTTHKTSLVLLLALAVLCILFCVSIGSVNLPLTDTFKMLFGMQSDLETHNDIFYQLRLPRVLAAFTVGGLLALAGVLMQVLLKNPLADPYVMGISGGAAFGALLGLYFNLGPEVGYLLAACGALLSIVLVFLIAHGEGNWSASQLLLTGIVLAAGWGALISLILAISPAKPLRSMMFWLMGDLSFSNHIGFATFVLVSVTIVCYALARALNLLAQSDTDAALLGIDVTMVRRIIFVLSAILTATAVIIGGTIGFVGLIVPHLLRLWKTGDHRWLVPASVLTGGCILSLADTAARTLLAPQQLPVGAVTAILGVPLFLYLIKRSSR